MAQFTQTTTFVNGQTADGGQVNTEIVNLGTSVNNITAAQITDDTITLAKITESNAWDSFTPTWTSATGGPVIGSGTLTGRWAQIGNIVIAHYYLLFAADTNVAGTGAWYFTFPTAQNTSQQLFTGVGYCVNTGVGFSEMTYISPKSNTTVELHNYGGASIGEGAPFAWGNGDKLYFTLIYEAA